MSSWHEVPSGISVMQLLTKCMLSAQAFFISRISIIKRSSNLNHLSLVCPGTFQPTTHTPYPMETCVYIYIYIKKENRKDETKCINWKKRGQFNSNNTCILRNPEYNNVFHSNFHVKTNAHIKGTIFLEDCNSLKIFECSYRRHYLPSQLFIKMIWANNIWFVKHANPGVEKRDYLNLGAEF